MRIELKVIFCLCLLALNLEGQRLRVNDDLSTRNVLSQNSGYAFWQDVNGFVWIATQVDVIRFIRGQDAKELKKFPYSELGWAQVCDNAVFAEFGGHLWIGTCDGLGKISTKDYKNYTKIKGSRGLDIRSMIRIGEKWLLLGTSDNLYQAQINENDSLIISDTLFDKARHECRSILNVEGQYWIGTDKGLFRYAPDSSGLFSVRINGRDMDVSALIQDSDSTLLAADKEYGLLQISTKHTPFEVITSCGDGPCRDVNAILKDEQYVWLGKEGTGLALLDRHLDTIDSSPIENLEANQVKALFRSNDGTYWIGTRGNGVKMICTKRQSFSRHYHPTGEVLQPEFFVWCIFPHPVKDSLVYIGTDQNGLCLYNYKTNTLVDSQIAGKTRVNCITIDSLKQNIFAGTDSGLVKIELRNPNNPAILNKKLSIASILYKGNRLFLGAKDKGLFVYDPSKKLLDSIPLDLPSGRVPSVWFLGQGEKDQILAGFEKGIRIIENPYDSIPVVKKDTFLFGDFEGQETVNCIALSSGSYWIGTRGNGLYRVSKVDDEIQVEIDTFNTQNGLLDNFIYGILPDHYNDLWLSTNLGVSKFIAEKKQFIHFYENDGLQHSEFNMGAYCAKNDSILFFGGLRGFSSFVPQLVPFFKDSLTITLAYLKKQDGKVITIENYLTQKENEPIPIDFDFDHIEFKIFSSDFQLVKGLSFRYWLKQTQTYAPDPIPVWGKWTFFLANKKGGIKKGWFNTHDYELYIQMLDVAGNYSEPFQITLSVKPSVFLGLTIGWWGVIGLLGTIFLSTLLFEYVSIQNRFDLLRKVGKKLAMANSEAQIQNILEEDLVNTGKLGGVLKSDLMIIFVQNPMDNTLQMIAGYEKGSKLSESFSFNPKDPLEQKERPAVWCWKRNWTHEWRDKNGNLLKGEVFSNNSPALFMERAGKVTKPKEGSSSGSMIYQLLELERNEEGSEDRKMIGLITVQSFKKNAYGVGIYRRILNIFNYPQRTLVSELLEDLGNSVASALIRVMKVRESDLAEAHLQQYLTIMDAHSIPKFVKQIGVLAEKRDKVLEHRFNSEIRTLLKSLPITPETPVFEEAENILKIRREDKELVTSFIKKVNNFVWMLLYEGERYITLENELNLIKSYEEIINIVYSPKVVIQTKLNGIPPNVLNSCIPSMLIQPLIENSIKHGRDYQHNNNHINIIVQFLTNEWKESKYLFLIVADDGIGINKRKEIMEKDKREAESNPESIVSDAYEAFEKSGKSLIPKTFKYLKKRIARINEKYGLGKKERMFYEVNDLSETESELFEILNFQDRFSSGTLIIIGIPFNFKFEKNDKD